MVLIKRSGFTSSIHEFLSKSNDEILGELTDIEFGSKKGNTETISLFDE